MNPTCLATRRQVTVLGINSLFGKVVSFLLKQSPVANRLVLYDEVDTGVAHDIAEIPTTCKVVVYDGEEQLRCAIRNSDVILIGDKDDCLAGEDEAINRKAADMVRYAEAISCVAPTAIVLIAATPVNSLLPLFTEALIGSGTFDCDKVMGVTSADTMRASTLLARHMGIDPEKAYLPVIGGSSSDTRIPLFSQSRPTIKASKNELRDLTRVVKMTEANLKRMLGRGEALNKAYATVQLIDSVMSALRGQRNISEIVLSRTCLVPNVDYFSLPVILGPRGIAHRFPLPSLTEREAVLLDHAVKHIEIDKIKGINALVGGCCIPLPPQMTEQYSELVNCQNDFVGSLIEKFKIGGQCPEICRPRVEYKLLSKVKLKLPPESKPSEMPKRVKFIEPDTPPQDGCCPLKLPCTPVPPIRGLNQIQAKHTCKTRDKRKKCKCFFPPVENTLVPCKLCPSGKPCVDYDEFKLFYEEHRHCCVPICCTGLQEQSSASSEVAEISAGMDSQSLIAQDHHSSNNQLYLNSGTTVAESSNTKSEPILPNRPPEDPVQPNLNFHAVLEHPRTQDPPLCPETSLMAKAQGHAPQLMNPESKHNLAAASVTSTPHNEHTNPPNIQDHSQFSSLHSQQDASSSGGPDSRHGEGKQSTITHQKPNKPNNQSSQQDDPDWPFKCSTSLCLDIMAPKLTDDPPKQVKPMAAQIELPPNIQNIQKGVQTEPRPDIESPASSQHPRKDEGKHSQQRQHQKYNYSSGLTFIDPQNAIEGIGGEQPLREEIRSLLYFNIPKSTWKVDSKHPRHERRTSSNESNNKQDFDSASEASQSNAKSIIENISNGLKEYRNQSAPTASQNNINDDAKIGGFRTDSLEKHTTSTMLVDQRAPECINILNQEVDDKHKRDENAKRRMYTTLKVIEDVKKDTHVKSLGKSEEAKSSLSTYLNLEPRSSVSKKILSDDHPESTMLASLRERAKAINANLELQRELRACLARRRQKKSERNLGNLIGAINPAKRLPKRLESRPVLKKSVRSLRRIYESPKHLGNQGKSAGMVLNIKPDNSEKALIIAEDSKEPERRTRIDRIKYRIQEALKKIIYPVDTSENDPAHRPIYKQQLIPKMVTRAPIKRSSKAKHDFFSEMRRTDPAYQMTSKIYAPKCPTRLLFDDHPNNHSKIITFNNVLENETPQVKQPVTKFQEYEPEDGGKKTEVTAPSFNFPDVPNFPDLNFNTTEPYIPPTLDIEKPAETLTKPMRQEPTISEQTLLRGDYVKHFETHALRRDVNNFLPEALRAVIRERSQKVVTPGIPRTKCDPRYRMTSPNRMTYPKKPD